MTPSFDLFAPGAASAAVLTAVRITGLVTIAPIFSAVTIPRLVRVAFLVVLTVLLQPVAFSALHAAPELTVTAIASEALIGLAIGLGAAIIVGAAEMAGDVVAVQMGLSGSAIVDPLDTTQLPVLGVFFRLFAIALLLSFDMHHIMLSAIADSFDALPVGARINMSGGIAAMLQAGGNLFALGVRFAAPIIAVGLIVTVALAVLSRAAQQLNLLSISFPIQIAAGLLALSAALPTLARTLGSWAVLYRDMLEHIGRGFAVAAR